VSKLAALLRIADGLDATHSSLVKGIECVVATERLTIKLKAKGDPSAEESEALKKGDLFHKVFRLEIVLKNEGG
jgi:exopolyphosphatase/guanosine-5'-triphosphate,3'-diphosphate pyrophosphatase